MPPIIHLIRHGEGEHQLEPLQKHRQIPDAPLTKDGVQRCSAFGHQFPVYTHIDLICSSPLRRAVQTAQYCFANALPDTETGKILLLPLAQENTDEPCDVGAEPEAIAKEFGDLVDLSMVSKGWNSKKGGNSPDSEALKGRARELRIWLRGRSESDIVVTGHGTFWEYVVGEEDSRLPPWQNLEWRWFSFDEDGGDDAWLKEEAQSIMRRHTLSA